MADSTTTHPKASPPAINLTFGRPWSILRPRVYRYLESKYVEGFFSNGSLRLSSFARFAEHPDEQRKDAAEGKGVRFGLGSQATIALVGGKGHDCYVLCGTVHNTENVRRQFKQYDACIAIDNVTAFANAVSLRIPFFRQGLEGLVIYQDNTTINKNIGNVKSEELIEKYKNPDGTVKMDLIHDIANMTGGIEEFFVKHSRYAQQCEYRILWASSQSVESFIDIKVPEAIQFCRHVTTES